MFLLSLCSCTREVVISEGELPEDVFYLDQQLEPFTGKCRIIYTDTNLVKEMLYFKNGRLNGEASSFYSSGRLKWRGNYVHGCLSGKWVFWDEKGNKTYEVHFQNDTMKGEYKSWYPNGQYKETGQFTDNSRTGEWQVYNEKGKIIRTHFY